MLECRVDSQSLSRPIPEKHLTWARRNEQPAAHLRAAACPDRPGASASSWLAEG
ncbi:hypothetical protein Y09_2761 [Brachybacterium sp. SW0106-09]|nr:hypothetical protein Y09_2761 [Brachybacterium sp. SW0106-09]